MRVHRLWQNYSNVANMLGPHNFSRGLEVGYFNKKKLTIPVARSFSTSFGVILGLVTEFGMSIFVFGSRNNSLKLFIVGRTIGRFSSLGRRVTGSPGHWITGTGSPDHQMTRSPGHWIIGSPGHRITGSPGHPQGQARIVHAFLGGGVTEECLCKHYSDDIFTTILFMRVRSHCQNYSVYPGTDS